jgi:hypothetical protein
VREHLLNYIALAPVITLNNPTEFVKKLLNSKIPELAEFLQIYEFLGTGWYNEVLASSICSIRPKICIDTIFNSLVDNAERMGVLISHYPAGTSTMDMLHWK